jgi:hypothetical protein
MGNWVGKCDQSDPEKSEVASNSDTIISPGPLSGTNNSSNKSVGSNNSVKSSSPPPTNNTKSNNNTDISVPSANNPANEIDENPLNVKVGGSKRKSEKPSRKTTKSRKTRKSKISRKH